jgi:hypothetical protein
VDRHRTQRPTVNLGHRAVDGGARSHGVCRVDRLREAHDEHLPRARSLGLAHEVSEDSDVPAFDDRPSGRSVLAPIMASMMRYVG